VGGIDSPRQRGASRDFDDRLTISLSLSFSPILFREGKLEFPLAQGISPLSCGTMQQVSLRPAASVLSLFSLTQLHAAEFNNPQVSHLRSRRSIPQLEQSIFRLTVHRVHSFTIGFARCPPNYSSQSVLHRQNRDCYTFRIIIHHIPFRSRN